MANASFPTLIRRYVPEISEVEGCGSRRILATLIQRYNIPADVHTKLWRQCHEHYAYRLTNDVSTLEPAEGLVEAWAFASTLSVEGAEALHDEIVTQLREHGFSDDDLELYLVSSRMQALQAARMFYLAEAAQKKTAA